MSYCPNCGKEFSEGQKFCGNCGTKIEEPTKVEDGNSSENINNISNGNKNSGCIWIIIIAIIIILLYAAGQPNNNASNNISNDDIIENSFTADTQETNTSVVKEDVFPPEATIEHTYNGLVYKLPGEYYFYKTTPENGNTIYCTELQNNEEYIFAIASKEATITLDELVNIQDWNIENMTILNEKEIKTENINGITWYVKGIEYKSDINVEEKHYMEYYYSKLGNTSYRLTFEYVCITDDNLDLSKMLHFYNIKQSLRVN
jgi:hypothetical protein